MRTDFTVMPWLAKKMRARSAGVHAVRVVAGWVGAQLARIMPTDHPPGGGKVTGAIVTHDPCLGCGTHGPENESLSTHEP